VKFQLLSPAPKNVDKSKAEVIGKFFLINVSQRRLLTHRWVRSPAKHGEVSGAENAALLYIPQLKSTLHLRFAREKNTVNQ